MNVICVSVLSVCNQLQSVLPQNDLPMFTPTTRVTACDIWLRNLTARTGNVIQDMRFQHTHTHSHTHNVRQLVFVLALAVACAR